MYFYVQTILHHLSISLPLEDRFSKVKNFYIKSTYYKIPHDFAANADETSIDGIGFVPQNMLFLVMKER